MSSFLASFGTKVQVTALLVTCVGGLSGPGRDEPRGTARGSS